MTLLAERPATTEPAPETAKPGSAVGAALRGGSYVTLPAGSVRAGAEGTYITVPGSRKIPSATHGSYVTAAGAPAGAGRRVEGSYVTLSKAD
ncbi:hypothetical protein J2Y66_002040 [Paenarthrobacter nitroguajacolicus]|uniref:hypothetical protein n=1 Tax=Paenarthrobacter nitroguajacolicus TaxID=211146 RepID=UPI0028633534|nr:hypothetical protein [Paenarthrobacter nitroguajacolicus]MDR6987558.1 hypothetical protein [Paenarthrobacter nitroguajacolicus]